MMKKSLVILFLHLFGHLAGAVVYLYNLTNKLGEFQDYPTEIGPAIPIIGMKGQYVYLQMNDSCSPNVPLAPKNHTWFALIDLNYSCYPMQIYYIQKAGYALAILSKRIDDEDDDEDKQKLQTLSGDDNDYPGNGSINIPSTYVSNNTKVHLVVYSGKPNIIMYIYPEYHDINRFMLILLGTLCLAIVVALLLFLLIYGCYRVYRIRKSIITKWRLKFLPTYIFKKGDSYEVCVICLDEYAEDARLRILSCGHAFHCKCVDPWLIKSGRECPLCKRKADLRRGRNKGSTDRSHDDNENGLSDERTALLGNESRDNYDDDDDDDHHGNPVRLIPEMQTTINAVIHSHSTSDSNPQRRNYGATGSVLVPPVAIIGGHSLPKHNPAHTRAPLVRTPHTNPPFIEEQSKATFYIGSVSNDEDTLINVGDYELPPHQDKGEVAPPQSARLHGNSDEESEEDFYDVRNEYHA